MELVRISELSPALHALESKRFKAAVTLLWPYSSSARQFALLLAEPDFRLRRKKGQVRVRFSGSSAKAIATTGVGIGDEVILSLRGAEFVQGGTVNTPGKSIDWELSYAQTVVVQVFRNGVETASLEMINVAPTPAPLSPARRETIAAPSPARQWSSPAFLKRVRLSDGPLLEAPYDPLADEDAGGHDKKRRRKSYKDWKAWTYSARTPSPEKDDASIEDELDEIEASPSRPAQLPVTPVSPSKPEMLSVAASPLDCPQNDENSPSILVEEAAISAHNHSTDETANFEDAAPRPADDNIARDADYYELYAGPDEFPPSDAQYAFGGDTEVDTEVNTEEEDAAQNEPAIKISSTEEYTRAHDYDDLHTVDNSPIEIESVDSGLPEVDAQTTIKDASLTEVRQTTTIVEVDDYKSLNTASIPISASVGEVTSSIVMPPPTLPTIQTSFTTNAVPNMLTPLGREPASPTLRPLDSALLPFPSPFPGERDTNFPSYLDHDAAGQRSAETNDVVEEDQGLPSEASYILETSFFSSIGSNTASAWHPNHESAFTPVRFTFGMDGAGFSRPIELSSPALDNIQNEVEFDAQLDAEQPFYFPEISGSTSNSQVLDSALNCTTYDDSQLSHDQVIPETKREEEVMILSSGSEAENSEVESTFEKVLHEDLASEVNDTAQGPYENEHGPVDFEDPANMGDRTDLQFLDVIEDEPTYIQPPTDASAVVDLDPQSDDTAGAVEPVLHSHTEPAVLTDDPPQTREIPSHSEFVYMDFAPEFSNAVAPPEQQAVTHTKSEQGMEPSIHMLDDEQSLALGEDPDTLIEELNPMDELSNLSSWEQPYTGQQHPDIKLESIEDDSLSQVARPDTQVAQTKIMDPSADPSGELVITVPQEGHKLGELHAISVPATGPARNTRSKTKPSSSPNEIEQPISDHSTSPAEPKVLVSSIARTALSPPVKRTRSTLSPTQDDTQTSHRILRSQPKPISPSKSISASTTATIRKSPRRYASHRSLDSNPDTNLPQSQDPDSFLNELVPSTGNTESQVTVPAERASPTLAASRSKARSPESSPSRRLRSAGSPGAAPLSPQDVRRTRRHVYQLPKTSTTERSDEAIRVAKDVAIQAPPDGSDGEGAEPGHAALPLSGAVTLDKTTDSSTTNTPLHSLRNRSIKDNKQLITPQATQQAVMESQASSFADSQPNQDLLITPEPTQGSSADMLLNIETEQVAVEPVIKASPIAKSTPRRNVTVTDVASRSASPAPKDASSDIESDSSPNKPSIGLSTPLAYYTPLKDLVYFLNRSSQFHSSSNPDILALVTSSTTTPQRATKGPKHWHTTLHITDASTWPATTAVQCFRAYQTALPHTDTGDIILLRAFAVRSLNRHPTLISADESAWCVWRYGKPVWGAKRGAYGQLRAREEVKGPAVERGEGEWREVKKLRSWYTSKVKKELEEKEESQVHTRSRDKVAGKESKDGGEEVEDVGVTTRSRDKARARNGEAE